MKIKIFLILVCFIVFLGLGLYKYNEWTTVKQLNQFHNNFFKDHTALMEKNFKLVDDFYARLDTFTKNNENKTLSSEDIKKYWKDEIISACNLFLNISQETTRFLSKQKNDLNAISQRNKYIIGSKHTLISKYIQEVDEYIDSYTWQEKMSEAQSFYQKNYAQLQIDLITLNDFDAAVPSNNLDSMAKYASVHFGELSSLQIYTQKDFKFEGQDLIQDKLPESFEFLNKLKQYMASYYEMIKDMAAFDLDSAEYKWSKFQENRVALNVDESRLDEEATKKWQDLRKKILLVENELINTINMLNNTQFSYPFVREKFVWSDTLVKCDYIIVSAENYNDIVGKYPDATSFSDLNNELNNKGILTTSYFYEDNLFKITNNKETLSFTCTDPVSNTQYNFVHHKFPDETEEESESKSN